MAPNSPFNRTEAKKETKWYDEAQCKGVEVESLRVPDSWLYFSLGTEDFAEINRDIAKVCDGCPVIQECARDALDHEDGGYVRGGLMLPELGKDLQRSITVPALRLIACGGSREHGLEAIRQLALKVPTPTPRKGRRPTPWKTRGVGTGPKGPRVGTGA